MKNHCTFVDLNKTSPSNQQDARRCFGLGWPSNTCKSTFLKDYFDYMKVFQYLVPKHFVWPDCCGVFKHMDLSLKLDIGDCSVI